MSEALKQKRKSMNAPQLAASVGWLAVFGTIAISFLTKKRKPLVAEPTTNQEK